MRGRLKGNSKADGENGTSNHRAAKPLFSPSRVGCAPPLFCWFWGVHTRFFGVSLQSNSENEFYSKLAALHLEKYTFPVEMIICLPNGTVVRPPLQIVTRVAAPPAPPRLPEPFWGRGPSGCSAPGVLRQLCQEM